jgi:hypothetical protein
MTDRSDGESSHAGDRHAPPDARSSTRSACGTVDEQDVLLLRALVDRYSHFSGLVRGHNNTFARCEVFLPDDAPRDTNAGPIGEALCFVEASFGGIKLLRRRDQADTKIGEIGSGIRKRLMVLGKRAYSVRDASGTELMSVLEEPESILGSGKLYRLSLPRTFDEDRLAFWHGDRRLGCHQPDRASKTDSVIDMTLDRDRLVDRRLSLAVSCLDLLRQRDETLGTG